MPLSNYVLRQYYDVMCIFQYILKATKVRVVFVDQKRLDILCDFLTPDTSVSLIVLTNGTPTADNEVGL